MRRILISLSFLFLLTPFYNVQAAPETLFLAGFDGTYQDFSKNDSAYMLRGYAPAPFFDTRPQFVKFGTGSMRLTGAISVATDFTAINFLPKQNIDLGTDEFTMDVWIYPYLDTGKDLNSDNIAGGSFFALSDSEKDTGSLYPISSLLRNNSGLDNIPTFSVYEQTSVSNWQTKELLRVPASIPLVAGQWNHIAIQRTNSGSNSSFTVSVNGKVGTAVTKDTSFALPVANRLSINDAPVSGRIYGFMDELRILKGAAIWGDTPVGGTFDINKITSSITQDLQAKAQPLQPPYVVSARGSAPSFLLTFDQDLNPSVGNVSVSPSDSSVAIPVVSGAQKRVGGGSVSFNGNKNALIYTPKGNELALGGGDFTIDFWLYPRSLSSKNDGSAVHLFSLKDASGKTFLLERYNYSGGLKTLVFGPVANHPADNNTFGAFSVTNWQDIVPGQWNHIALQREGGDLRYIVNGVVSGRAQPVDFTGNSTLTIGDVAAKSALGEVPYAYDGYIDNFRVTKAALWPGAVSGDKVALPDNAGASIQAPIVGRTGEDLNANRVGVPDKEAVPTVAIAPSQESVDIAAAPSRTSAQELVVRKPNGDRNYTNYYDSGNILIRSIFWAENTGNKQTKILEYDTQGELSKATYYDVDGNVSDVDVFYTKDQGGGLYKEVEERNGAEIYSRYDTQGKVIYSHQVKNGSYLYSKYFTYDTNGNLTEDLTYTSSSQFEKNVYTLQDGAVIEVKNYSRIPQATDGGDYVYTDSVYSQGKIVRTKKIYARSSDMALQKVEIISPTDTRIFDYANNAQRYITPAAEYVWAIDTGNYQYKISYEYDAITGALTGKTKVTGSGDITAYRTDNPDSVDTTSIFTWYPDNKGWKDETVTYYDKDGAISKVLVNTFSQTALYVQTAAIWYDKSGVKTQTLFYENGIPDHSETYDVSGTIWQRGVFSPTGVASENRVSAYYVMGNTQILQSVRVYNKSDNSLIREESKDNLAQKKYGDAILASLSISLNNVTASNEKDTLLTVLKTILPRYKASISAPGLSSGQKYDIYSDYSRSIMYASWAIEYKIWGSDSSKSLSTDDEFAYNSVTPWTGTDRSGKPFYGIYINPAGIPRQSPDALFIDMDIANPSSVDVVVAAASLDSLTSIPKKTEKWDSTLSGPSIVYDATANRTLHYYNMAANGGSGAYLTLADLTQADPTVNLLIDRMQEDLGVSLNASLSEADIIKQFYAYFYSKNLFQYLYDFGDTVQTVNQTLVRGGGDCEDFGTFALSLLKNLFLRLGKKEAANRLGLGIGSVDTTNKISATNRGVGHAALVYKDAQGKYYWIESAYLFMGTKLSLDRTKILTLLDASKGGGSGALSGRVQIVPNGWYVEVHTWNGLDGKTQEFATSYPQTLAIETPALVGTSATDKIATLPTYIEPYDKKIDALAENIIKYIPRFAEQTSYDLAQYVNSFMRSHSSYRSDATGDTWTRVSETLAAPSIQGDCEDLAFVEASLLQNILTKYYLARSMTAVNAALAAQGNVYLIAQNNYGGVTDKTHVLVGFVDPSFDNNLTTVSLMDPQTGVMNNPVLFSSLFNDKYLFFANTRKVSSITPYDWNNLNLSSKVDTGDVADSASSPQSVDPVAPTVEAINALDNLLGSIASKNNAGTPLTAYESSVYDQFESFNNGERTGPDIEIAMLLAAQAQSNTTQQVQNDIRSTQQIVNTSSPTDPVQNEKLAALSQLETKLDAQLNTIDNAMGDISQKLSDVNNSAESLNNIANTQSSLQGNLDHQINEITNDVEQGNTSQINTESAAQTIDSASNALGTINSIVNEANAISHEGDLIGQAGGLDEGDIADYSNTLTPCSGSCFAGEEPAPETPATTENPVTDLLGKAASYQMYTSPPPVIISNNTSPVSSFDPTPTVDPFTGQVTFYTQYIRPYSCTPDANVTKLCSAIPSNLKITTKPDNSTFVGRDTCASSQNVCSDDTVFHTGWQCNPGFIESNGRCLSIIVNPDVCANISGSQTSVPAGMIKDASGNCVALPDDVCLNVDGVQTSVPDGLVRDTSNNCFPPPDVCPNIADTQTSIPASMIKDASGNCVLPVNSPPSTGGCGSTCGGRVPPPVVEPVEISLPKSLTCHILNAAGVEITISPINKTVTWVASPDPSSGTYIYDWSGGPQASDNIQGSNITANKSYATTGMKSASVTFGSPGNTITLPCDHKLEVLNLNFNEF